MIHKDEVTCLIDL